MQSQTLNICGTMVLDPNIFFPSTGALETYLIFIGLYQFYLRSHLLITQVEFQYNPTRVNSYLPGTGSHIVKTLYNTTIFFTKLPIGPKLSLNCYKMVFNNLL